MYKNLFKIAMSIALVATLLVGCKADDEITITHFKFEGASRVFFEPGQTINVNYNKRRVSKIEIERKSNAVTLFIYTAKPGVVIGKGGNEIEVTKKELSKLTDKKVLVDIKEIKRPDKDAQLVAENIAQQLENRVSFRRAMKSTMSRTMKAGALGIKTSCSGRLGGADMARTEFYSEGTIPLQTLRADIDYGFYEADTTYGKIGVKVWIYKGEILNASAQFGRERKEERAPREICIPVYKVDGDSVFRI